MTSTPTIISFFCDDDNITCMKAQFIVSLPFIIIQRSCLLQRHDEMMIDCLTADTSISAVTSRRDDWLSSRKVNGEKEREERRRKKFHSIDITLYESL